MSNVVDLKAWEVVRFPWGSAVRHSKGKWDKIFVSPTGQEIDVSELNVVLHDNGIEFVINKVTCPECKGHGEWLGLEGATCKTCDGRGYISE